MEFNEILPCVLVGSCPRTTSDIDCLIDDYGISAVLNVQTDSDLAYWQIDWPQLAEHYQVARRQGWENPPKTPLENAP
jgi:hypothetical protein